LGYRPSTNGYVTRLEELGPETIYGVLADYFADREGFSSVQEQVFQIGSQVMATILKRAEERGEVPPGLSPRVATLPIDLFRHEMFVRRGPPTSAVIAEIVDDVFLPLVGGRLRLPLRSTLRPSGRIPVVW